MKKEVEIQTPSVPSFIHTFDGNRPIPIEDFSEKELKKIGTEWTKELVEKAKEKSKAYLP